MVKVTPAPGKCNILWLRNPEANHSTFKMYVFVGKWMSKREQLGKLLNPKYAAKY